jgi:hypothetical protein
MLTNIVLFIEQTALTAQNPRSKKFKTRFVYLIIAA